MSGQESNSKKNQDGNAYSRFSLHNTNETPRNTEENYTVALDNENAPRFSNVTRVGWKSRVDYALEEYNREQRRKNVDEDFDLHNLLCISVSTIILLASGHWDIPKEYYMYTENYLRAVKDESGNSPPNIGKLLRHIKYIKKQKNIDWGEEFIIEPPEGVVVAKLPDYKKYTEKSVKEL